MHLLNTAPVAPLSATNDFTYELKASSEERSFWREYLPHLFTAENADKGSTHPEDLGLPESTYISIPLPSALDPSSRPSPLTALPVEILRTIFELYISNYRVDGPSDIDCVDIRAPTTLIQICRHWRAIALHDPVLWCSIDVKSAEKYALPHVRLWLIRSGDHIPLSLGFEGCHTPVPGEEEIMSLYVANHNRWRNLRLTFWNGTASASLLRILAQLSRNPNPAPRLERVSLTCPTDEQNPAWDVIRSLPNLLEIKLGGFVPRCLQAGAGVLWGQLTTAEFIQVDIEAVWEVLPECRSVQNLRLSPREDLAGLPDMCSLTLPSVSSLSLSAGVLPNIGSMLNLLTTPNLQTLAITCGYHSCPKIFHDFLSRSGCELEMFTLNTTASVGVVLEYLGSPMLEKLKKVALMVSRVDGIFEALAMDGPQDDGSDLELKSEGASSGGVILPSLETIGIVSHFAVPDVDLEWFSLTIQLAVLTRQAFGKTQLKAMMLDVRRGLAMPKEFVEDMKALNLAIKSL